MTTTTKTPIIDAMREAAHAYFDSFADWEVMTAIDGTAPDIPGLPSGGIFRIPNDDGLFPGIGTQERESIEDLTEAQQKRIAEAIDAYVEALMSDLNEDDLEHDFVDGFAWKAPAGFDIEADAKASTPWCAPWTWCDDWWEDGKTAEENGQGWARRNYAEITNLMIEEQAAKEGM